MQHITKTIVFYTKEIVFVISQSFYAMNINSFKHWMPAGVLLLAIGVTSLSPWKEHPHQSKNIFMQEDTVPARHKVTREAGDRDLDKELQQLDEARSDWIK